MMKSKLFSYHPNFILKTNFIKSIGKKRKKVFSEIFLAQNTTIKKKIHY